MARKIGYIISGTEIGGRKADKTIKQRYDAEYLEKYGMTWRQLVGQKGGKTSRGGGWTGDTDRAREMGSKGGSLGRKGLRIVEHDERKRVYIDQHTGEPVLYLNVEGKWIRQ